MEFFGLKSNMEFPLFEAPRLAWLYELVKAVLALIPLLKIEVRLRLPKVAAIYFPYLFSLKRFERDILGFLSAQLKHSN